MGQRTLTDSSVQQPGKEKYTCKGGLKRYVGSRACHILQKMQFFEKMKKNTDIVLRNAILKHIYYYHFVQK